MGCFVRKYGSCRLNGCVFRGRFKIEEDSFCDHFNIIRLYWWPPFALAAISHHPAGVKGKNSWKPPYFALFFNDHELPIVGSKYWISSMEWLDIVSHPHISLFRATDYWLTNPRYGQRTWLGYVLAYFTFWDLRSLLRSKQRRFLDQSGNMSTQSSPFFLPRSDWSTCLHLRTLQLLLDKPPSCFALHCLAPLWLPSRLS